MEAGWLQTQVPLCSEPQIRTSLTYVPWPERTLVAADCRAPEAAAPLAADAPALEPLAERWDAQYPARRPRGLAAWARVTVLGAALPAICRVMDTTKARESVHTS